MATCRGLPAGELRASAPTAIATNGDLLIAGHTLDVEMEQIAGGRMFITHDGWGGMEMAPAVEMSPLKNTADGASFPDGSGVLREKRHNSMANGARTVQTSPSAPKARSLG